MSSLRVRELCKRAFKSATSALHARPPARRLVWIGGTFFYLSQMQRQARVAEKREVLWLPQRRHGDGIVWFAAYAGYVVALILNFNTGIMGLMPLTRECY